MKQHITPEQLDGLGAYNKKKLELWYEKYKWKAIPGSTDGDEYAEGYYIKPLLSIGQMIEFLDEYDKKLLGECLLESVMYDHDDGGDFVFGSEVDYLCDALWEACKDVLNNKSS